MHSVPYREIEHARPGSSAGEQRIATTATLVAVAVCMIVAEVHGAPTPVRQQEDNPPAVRIVDPEFCKNQTWPYIDARCLKRIAPDQPVAENRAGIVSTHPQVTPAPTAPLATAAISGAPASGNFAVPDASDAAGSAMHRTPPTAAMNGAGQNDIQQTIASNTAVAAPDNSVNTRVADSPRNHRSHHWQHGAFFGFRF